MKDNYRIKVVNCWPAPGSSVELGQSTFCERVGLLRDNM